MLSKIKYLKVTNNGKVALRRAMTHNSVEKYIEI